MLASSGGSRDLASRESFTSAASHGLQRWWNVPFLYGPLSCDVTTLTEEVDPPEGVEDENKEDDLELLWFGRKLPAWSYHRAAAHIISKITKLWDTDDHVKASSAATRLSAYAWRFAMYGVILYWSAWIICPAVVVKSNLCQHHGGGLPTCSHYAMLPYVPGIVLAMGLENQVLATMIPLEVAYIGGKRLFGCNIPFVMYRLMISGISVLSYMDVSTNSLFLGRVLLTTAGSDCKLDSVWRTVAKHSVFRSLPDFTVLAILAYGTMVLQLLFALYYGLPLFTNASSRVKGLRCWLTLRAPEMVSPYAITLHSKPEEVWGTQLLRAIAPAARMSAASFRDAEFFNVSDGAQVRSHGGDPWTRFAMADLARLAAMRCFLRLCTEGAIFANLQATVLGMNKAIDGLLDPTTMVSVLLSCCTAAYSLWQDMNLVYATLHTVWPALDDGKMTDLDRKYQAEGYKEMNRSSLKGQVIRTMILSCVTIVVFCWWTAYAALKCVMAYYCADGVWNFAWPLRDGCVVLSGLASG